MAQRSKYSAVYTVVVKFRELYPGLDLYKKNLHTP